MVGSTRLTKGPSGRQGRGTADPSNGALLLQPGPARVLGFFPAQDQTIGKHVLSSEREEGLPNRVIALLLCIILWGTALS